MGIYKYRDFATKAEVLRELMKDKSNLQTLQPHRVIDKSVRGNEVWLLREFDGKRYLELNLIEKNKGLYMYKPMSEEYGPKYYNVPKRMVEKANHLVNKEWRKTWKEVQSEKKEQKPC